MERDDLLKQIEIQKQKAAKKKVNSKDKGSRGELDIVKMLKPYFGDGFMRVPRSGGAVGGQNFNEALRKDATDILGADIITPPDFTFSLESKFYNEEGVRIRDFLSEKDYNINEWWKQTCEDALKKNKKPMLIVRLNRAKPFAMIRYDSVIFQIQNEKHFKNTLVYFNNESESLFLIEFEQLLEHCDERFWGMTKIKQS